MASEIVLKRLNEMKDGVLDIENLRLTELPESNLWEQVKFLGCCFNQLTKLPKLPNIIYLNCSHNRLIELPELPNIKTLICFNNYLTKLPTLPNVRDLYCFNNQITELPELPELRELQCFNNQIIELPELPKVISLRCDINLLKFQPKHYKYIHQIRKVAIVLSVVKQWRKFNQLSVTTKKQDLHNELLYSPELPFYKNTEGYQHWFKQLK